MPDLVADLRSTLSAHEQEHLLTFYDRLPPSRQQQLLAQLQMIDFEHLDTLIDEYVRNAPPASVPDDPQPAPVFPSDIGSSDVGREARTKGEQLIAEGRLAVFTVAGGQGTRLGWNGPKGTYPATAVTGKPLFRIFAEQILAAQRRWKTTIPWYIMTSPLNDADTRAFFLDNNCFGLRRNNIMMFEQGTMPSIDAATGKLLLAGQGEVAVNPDGHGGSFRALRSSGAIEDMQGRGVEHISYIQVDNPLARAVDPLFLGLHAHTEQSDGLMSSKVVPKASPEERVGVVCRVNGRTQIIEYSDLPSELAGAIDDTGTLRFNAGSIAIHAISVSFAARLGDRDSHDLPYHRAVKAVPYVDPTTGEVVEPAEPNAVKLEMFVFDALPLAGRSIVLETTRVGEFAPIKNRTGNDSPATSHQLQSDHYGGWLAARGVEVAMDGDGHAAARIEISPLTAMEPEQLDPSILPNVVHAGDALAL